MVIIKEAAELKKDRRNRGEIRTRISAVSEANKKVDTDEEKSNDFATEETEESDAKLKGISKNYPEKVELKDIEQSLDEILS